MSALGDGSVVSRDKPPSEKIVRLLTGALGGPIVVGIAWLGWLSWWVFVMAACVQALREAYGIVGAAGRRPHHVLGTLMAIAMVAALVAHQWNDSLPIDPLGVPITPMLLVAGLIVLGYVSQMLRPAAERSFDDWSITIALGLHVGVLGAFAAGLRALDGGRFWVLLFLALIWTNDTMAYLGGRRFGKRKMAPALSPKKTWEGLAIATLSTIAVGAITPYVAGLFGAWAPAGSLSLALVGLAVSVVGPLGDLSISLLKRESGVKDSGHLIPGHGGVLDRTDSLFFAAPIMYVAALVLGG